MARVLLVLEEVIAMLEALKVPPDLLEAFRKQAEFAHSYKSRREVDDVTVTSGFGHHTQQGFVELSLNDQLTQMHAKKAREIGLMLLEAAEAAVSDEMIVTLLKQMGVPEAARGRLLMDLREIRQGTRGISRPS